MYSFAPEVGLNTLPFQIVVIVVIAMIVGVVLLAVATMNELSDTVINKGIVLIATITVFITWYQIHIYEPKVYANVEVRATLVETMYQEGTMRSGKYSMEPVAFVFYETPDGITSFKRREGVVYPKNAILYKN